MSAMSALSSPSRSGTNSRLGGAPRNSAVESDRDRRGKGDPFQEDLAAVGDAVAIGVLENQDAAVAGDSRSPATRDS